MKQCGSGVAANTISGWLDDEKPFLPGAKELWCINHIRPDITPNWLLGIGDATTDAERFIDQQIKD